VDLFLVLAVVTFGSFATFFVVSERRFSAAGYNRRRKPPIDNPAHVFVDGQSATMKGGARIGWSNASWPFATLSVDGEWIRVKSVVGTAWISRTSITSVRIVRGLMGPGVLFGSGTGAYDGVIFWTFAPGEVERALQWFRWPVTRG
jgi:hypothetical protein